MVQRCSVPLCDTKVGEVDVKGAKVRFHRIPLTPEKFLKWRNQITHFGKYKPEPELTVNSRICSKHFLREDYIMDEEQKPGIAGNHVLARNATPTIFKWNDETNSTLSRAVPYVKKAELQNRLNGLSVPSKSQEVQCSLEEDKLKNELQRKNIVIRQLLQRLGELEEVKESSAKDVVPISKKTNNNTQTTLSYFADDGIKDSTPSSSSTATAFRTDSPEMPTLTPSVPVTCNFHGLPEKPVDAVSFSNTSDVSTAIDYYEVHNKYITSSPQSGSTREHESSQNGNGNEDCPIKFVPVSQRVSVIKRAGGGCKSIEFSKPPKKRHMSYFYQ